MFGNNLFGFSSLYLGFLCAVNFVQFLTSAPIVDTGWLSTYDVSPFKRLISDYRFPICSIYENKECDAGSNDTKLRMRNPKLNNEVRNMGARNDAMSSPQEDLAVPFSVQPPIVTFDEWTKEKLKKEEIRRAEQQQNHQYKATVRSDAGEASKLDSSVSASKPAESVTRLAPPNIISEEATARNYASKECGAKVLFSNVEAENKNAILNEKEADDYMRNPCERAEHKWLVIELCETIQPTVLEIANFELFSSGPQNIKILGSERYPTNEWVNLGDFVVGNNREIQRFPIAARSYVKFFRLELLSHYGREHYCTLSLVRILGISMVDEYEAEAEAASVSDTSFSVPVRRDDSILNSHFRSLIRDHLYGPIGPAALNDPNLLLFSLKIVLQEVSAVNSTAAETVDTDVVSTVNAAKENESVDDLPFVNAVVSAVGNTVGSIGIGNIKGVLESTFLSKRSGMAFRNVTRSNATVMELCTQCSHYTVNNYVLFCRAFFGVHHSFVRTRSVKEMKNKQVHIQSFSENQKKNRTRVQDFFLASVLPTYFCDMESGNYEKVQNFISYETAESDGISTVPPTVNSPTLLKKLGGGFMIPGGVISHKESIFLKLNKRISSLELNMSLSSEYLSELSRRYVLQTNESRRQAELIIKQAEEAAINAVRPSINALKIQMDALAASLRELTETVKGLPEEVSAVDRTIILKNVEGRDSDADASLARFQTHFYGCLSVWTTGELVCIVVFINFLTLVVLLVLHYGSSIINRGTSRQAMDDQIQKFIRNDSDVRSTDEVSERNEPNPEQQSVADTLSVLCDLVDVTQVGNVITDNVENVSGSSLTSPNEICLLSENENETSEGNHKLQSVELAARPSSQLSTRDEQNFWQIKKRKNKKRKANRGNGDVDEPLYGFKILANLGIE